MQNSNLPITPRRLLVIIIEVILVILIAMTLVSIVQMYAFAPIAVSKTSMVPTLRDGDKVYINKAFSSVSRGDVVVVYLPTHFADYGADGYSTDWWEYVGENDDTDLCPASRAKTFDDFINFLPFVQRETAGESTRSSQLAETSYFLVIKRIVGLPGDRIKIENQLLFVNGELEERADLAVGSPIYTRDYPEKTLGENEYFVMGDNRAVSDDSHLYGPVKGNWIYGKVVCAFKDGKLVTKL